jgi:hypothetical protein
MSLKNYNIKNCQLTVGGLPVKEGLVSFGVAPVGARFASDAGADGMVTRWDTNDPRHTCTLILKGGSKENQVLSAIHAADIATFNGAGVVLLSFVDEQGASIMLGNAWITGMPEKVFAASPGDVSWAFEAVFDSPLNFVIGGN